MKIGINGINIRGEKKKILKTFIEFLKNKNFTIYFSSELDKCFSKSVYKIYNEKNTKNLDFIISLGGDGTLLNTVTHVGKSGTKILGVNIGKLGFLSFDVHDVFSNAVDISLDFLNKVSSLDFEISFFSFSKFSFF